MRPDLLERYVEDFQAAGMTVERRTRRKAKTLFVITTGTREDWSQVLWSILEPDRCYVEEEHDHTGHFVYRTWYPTRYFERLWREGVRKFWLLFWVMLTLIPAMLASPFGIAARTGAEVGVIEAVVIIALLVGLLLGAAGFLRDEGGFDTTSLPPRLMVGVLVGLVWAVFLGIPSTTNIVGAVWVFVISNFIWIGTVGYDRWRFEKCVERVGGRLSRDEANRRLQSWNGS